MNELSIFLLILVLVVGCSWENEESLYPVENCDTLEVSFAVDVVPVLVNYCYTCHSNANAPEFAQGIALEDYQDVSANSSLIVGAINHQEGFPAMPKGSEKLDNCSIGVFEAWVIAGMPDN